MLVNIVMKYNAHPSYAYEVLHDLVSSWGNSNASRWICIVLYSDINSYSRDLGIFLLS